MLSLQNHQYNQKIKYGIPKSIANVKYFIPCFYFTRFPLRIVHKICYRRSIDLMITTEQSLFFRTIEPGISSTFHINQDTAGLSSTWREYKMRVILVRARGAI